MNNENQKSHSEDALCVSKPAKSLKRNSGNSTHLPGQRKGIAEHQGYPWKSDPYQSHKVWGWVEGYFLPEDDNGWIIKYTKSCKMITAQEGHRLSKLSDKQRKSLYDFATDHRRQDSHPKAGHFLEYFYQQQEVVSQCSCQTFPRTADHKACLALKCDLAKQRQ